MRLDNPNNSLADTLICTPSPWTQFTTTLHEISTKQGPTVYFYLYVYVIGIYSTVIIYAINFSKLINVSEIRNLFNASNVISIGISVCLSVGLATKVPKLTHHWVVLFHT